MTERSHVPWALRFFHSELVAQVSDAPLALCVQAELAVPVAVAKAGLLHDQSAACFFQTEQSEALSVPVVDSAGFGSQDSVAVVVAAPD